MEKMEAASYVMGYLAWFCKATGNQKLLHPPEGGGVLFMDVLLVGLL